MTNNDSDVDPCCKFLSYHSGAEGQRKKKQTGVWMIGNHFFIHIFF